MKFFFLLILTFGFVQSQAQKFEHTFYEHYTGLISNELKITADLIKSQNSFSGFYYYEYEEEGLWISSNPIALDGQVHEDGSFILNEFGGQTSYFQGILESSKLISGVWINDMIKDDVDFTLKATYPKGSINLKLVEKEQRTYFQKNKGFPHADLNYVLLFPDYKMDRGVYYQLISRIYYFLGYRGNVEAETNILAELGEKYDQQFQNSLNNIQLDSFPQSFNWNKSIRMDVINNESGLLCLQFDTYAKSGKRDGTLVRKYLVFDIDNNKILDLDDIFDQEEYKVLLNIIDKKVRDQYKLKESQSLSSYGFFYDTIRPTNNFYIHPGGIGFYYNLYEIAPFSNGSTDLFIPWSDFDIVIDDISDRKFEAFFNN